MGSRPFGRFSTVYLIRPVSGSIEERVTHEII